MKIKLKDKDNPITQLWCFMYRGYDSSLIEQINSGNVVESTGDDEIENMIKEAEANAEADKKVRELVDAKNQAEAIIHSAEKGIADAGDKITNEEKDPVEAAIKDLKEVLESEDLTAIQEKTASLSQAAMKIGEKLYQQEQEMTYYMKPVLYIHTVCI